MGRSKLIRSKRFPYHVSTRANHKFWFTLPLPQVWQITSETLKDAHQKHPIQLHALVLMANHYHMLLTTPEGNIDQFMFEFNKNFSLRLREKTGLCNRMFGSRYRWSLVRSPQYLTNVFRYIIQNPLRAKIIPDVAQYPYSSWHYEWHQKSFPIPLHPVIEAPKSELNEWLNCLYNEDDLTKIRRALCHSVFTLGHHRSSRTPYQLKTNPPCPTPQG